MNPLHDYYQANQDEEQLIKIERNVSLASFGVENEEEIAGLNRASWFSAYVNLTSTIIGAGILGTPYAFSRCGWILGTMMLCVGALFTTFGLHLLSICARCVKPPSSFYSVAEMSVPGLGVIVDTAIAIKCINITISYLMVIGDSMPKAFDQLDAPMIFRDRNACLLMGFCILAPLSYMERLDSLKYSSFISGVFILFLVFLIVVFSMGIDTDLLDPCLYKDPGTCSGTQSNFLFTNETLGVLGIFLFGYSCQQNCFTVVNELKNPTQSRVNSVFYAAAATGFSLYVLVSWAGYSTFGSNMVSDILTMYPETPLTSICRVMMSFVVACHFPLQLHPARRSLLSLLERIFGEDQYYGPGETNWRFVIVTTIHLAATLTIALIFTDLGKVLEVAGATGSTMVIFLLPGSFYYALPPLPGSDDSTLKRYAALFVAVLGCFLVPFCLLYILVL